MKVWFEGEAIDRRYPGDRFLRIIQESYALHWELDDGTRDSLVVPVRFVTDLASVPRPAWSIVPPWDNYIKDAAVVHDRAYETNEVSRSRADALLYYGMRARGASEAHAWTVWSAVRLGGAWSYRTGARRQQERLAKLAHLEKTVRFFTQRYKENVSC